MRPAEVFSIPVRDQYLLYAPLARFSALVNRRTQQEITRWLQSKTPVSEEVRPLVEQLSRPVPQPKPRAVTITDPLFLGLIPTRDCNLACRYCDFRGESAPGVRMTIPTAAGAIEAYLNLLVESSCKTLEVHFFGGEPFWEAEVLQFSVAYASRRAKETGLGMHFEATTNGVFSEAVACWAGDALDVIVLSLDGPREIQDLHRPARNGQSSFAATYRSAKIFAQSPTELILRACVSQESIHKLFETAAWFAHEFHPDAVCFETMTPTPSSLAAGLHPPDPWEFGHAFFKAARLLEQQGIEVILSTADISAVRTNFCPVGNDALIVSPDGSVDACYQLQSAWLEAGLDFHLGRLEGSRFQIDPNALQRVREMNIWRYPRCSQCLCCYHCAGGCHIHHRNGDGEKRLSAACIQTRIVTIARLLSRLGQASLADAWLVDRPALERSVRQECDRL